MRKPHIFIGTSGFYYKNWHKKFYPSDLKKEDLLKYYGQYFRTVEINSSFYHIPLAKTTQAWKEKVPEDFVFSFKASRSVTHLRQLEVDRKSISLLFQPLKIFKSSPPNHVVLFQMPSFLMVNNDRLAHLLKLLPEGFYYAFEFRHASWFQEETYKLLRQFHAALVLADSPKKSEKPLWPLTDIHTTDFCYIRFHGSKKLYVSSYSDEELKKYARLIREKVRKKMKVFVYFNNDAEGWAVENAKRLKTLLGV